MFILLTSLALAILPFYIWPGFDTRQPKLFMALVISLVLGLYVIFKEYFKPYKNIWFILFLLYIPLNFLLTPKLNLVIYGLPINTFWVVEAYLIILIFFLAHIAINSYQFTAENKTTIIKVMVWAGTIMAIYTIFQRLGFDQFWQSKHIGDKMADIAGTFGNRAILAPFLAMIIPLALYLRKYVQAIILIGVVFLCNSQIAYGAMIVSLMFLITTKSKKLMMVMVSLFISLSLILSVGYFKSPQIKGFVQDNYRFVIWKTIIKDLKTPREIAKDRKQQYALTGFGLGSFRYIFHAEHKNITDGSILAEAHNDYLQLLYDTGIIGLGLFLMGLWFIVKSFFPLDRLNTHLFASLICILISAGGIFCFQNGAIIFYTLVIVGLSNKREVQIGCQV